MFLFRINIKQVLVVVKKNHALCQTPVRGATLLMYRYVMGYLVSIHAPVRGATTYLQLIEIWLLIERFLRTSQ